MRSKQIIPPDQLYGQLFIDVQMGRVFPDSKTFVDCTPKFSAQRILDLYREKRGQPGFELNKFVFDCFDLPENRSAGFVPDPARNAFEHVESLWPYLTRDPDVSSKKSTRIPLPNSYVVPGGRFGEIYYWDSYFTMLGLEVSGRIDLIEDMVKNFAYLIDRFGYIPNGNRNYYLSRSQPPHFALMVQLLRRLKGDAILKEYYPALEKEYEFWMTGSEIVKKSPDKPDEYRRVVLLENKKLLNRYWDESDQPRQESYAEDVKVSESLLEESADPERFPVKDQQLINAKFYRNIRAACESGWDFSSRWLADGRSLAKIETTSIIPVDLNCLLFYLELTLMAATKLNGRKDKSNHYANLSRSRSETILNTFWDSEAGAFQDMQIQDNRFTDRLSLAMVYPLFFKIATVDQADAVAHRLSESFLKEGGLITTLDDTGQQWDAPNGWPPLQWVSIVGLKNYGFHDLAKEIAIRWTGLCEKVYAQSGKFVEKYNVVDTNLKAGGGEYPVQDGFGWSNGVYAKLKYLLDQNFF